MDQIFESHFGGNRLPEVVNRHWYHKTGLPPEARYIGRGTPLGNPFTAQQYEVDEALDLYRRWLWKKIRGGDEAVLAELRRITPETKLVCSCKPKPCHGDVVVRAWGWIRDQGMLESGDGGGFGRS